MGEQFWSGPGCENNPEFRLVSRDPVTRIGRFKKIGRPRFIGHEPGGVPVYKRTAPPKPKPAPARPDLGAELAKYRAAAEIKKERTPVEKIEAIDATIDAAARAQFPALAKADAVAKFLETDAGKALYTIRDTLSFAKSAGVRFEKIAAHASLEALAATIRKSKPALSAEAAYVAAMNENPHLAAAAIG